MSFESFQNPQKKASESLPDPGRRKFLKIMGAGAAYAAINTIPEMKEFAEEATSPEEIRKETERLKSEVEQRYAVSVHFDAIDNDTESGSGLSLIEQRNALRELEKSFSFYPKEYIKNTALKNIHVVNNYTRKGVPFTAGITNESQHPGRMLLNREHLFSKITFEEFFDSGMPETFHHELYHLSDEHDEHRRSLETRSFNTEWKKEHTQHGGDSYSPGVPFGGKGFPNSYARTSPTEQRAVIAELLMSDYNGLVEKSQEDPALANAVQKIKEEFFQKSSGIMDETYWNLVQTGDTDSIRQYIAAKEALQ
jgi:hypothetical protein